MSTAHPPTTSSSSTTQPNETPAATPAHVHDHTDPAHHHGPHGSHSPGHDHAHTPLHPEPVMDASKLNHTPAPLPPSPEETHPGSPPLRDPANPFTNPFGGNGGMESAYLDTEMVPQHPTVAETGEFQPSSPHAGPGPRAGQLKRRESEPMPQRRIIRLASFGGEGLAAKPARPCPGEEEVPEHAVE